MEEVICNSCGAIALDKAIFCYQCGDQIKCTNCQEVLVSGARHCIACGVPVNENQEHNTSPRNTIKLKENGEERLYEIQFSDNVGKEMKEVVVDLLKNKFINSSIANAIYQENLDGGASQALIPDNSKINNDKTSFSTVPLSAEPTITAQKIQEYPHLNDLELKLECRENEWLLLYAFYHSGFGVSTFSKEIVWQEYKNKRLTETRFKNLGTNWKSLFKKFICTVKENEFKFTVQGVEKANELLLLANQGQKLPHRINRKPAISASANAVANERRLPVSRKIVANAITAHEFDVYSNENKISLEEFFVRKKPGAGNPNRIVIIAYYITKINHQEYFTEGNIDYAYRILNLSGKPVHLKQVIINLKNSRIWFQKVLDRGTNGWRLTRQAEIYVEEKLPGIKS